MPKAMVFAWYFKQSNGDRRVISKSSGPNCTSTKALVKKIDLKYISCSPKARPH